MRDVRREKEFLLLEVEDKEAFDGGRFGEVDEGERVSPGDGETVVSLDGIVKSRVVHEGIELHLLVELATVEGRERRVGLAGGSGEQGE